MEGLLPDDKMHTSSDLNISSDYSLINAFSKFSVKENPFFKSENLINILTSISSVILELSRDNNWRVRLSVVIKTALLYTLLGPKKWEKLFISVLVQALEDHIYTVRETACTQISLIVKQAGTVWATDKLFPKAFSIYDRAANYLYRMTCLSIIYKLSAEEKVKSSVVQAKFYPIVSQAVTDDVANVRIYAAKCLSNIVLKVESSLKNEIKSQLQQLADDDDIDVVFLQKKH